MPRTRANADEPGSVSGKKECAAKPAKSALAGSWENRFRTRWSADVSARLPNVATWKGYRGMWMIGRRSSSIKLRQRATIGSNNFRYALASLPKVFAVSLMDRRSVATSVRLIGCAKGISGWHQSRPYFSSGRDERNSEPKANG